VSVCRSDPTETISRLRTHAKYCEQYNRYTRYTHNWSPLKSPNATTLPSVSSPRDPALSKAFPLNRFGGSGHIASVNGSHNQVETRAREDGRIRMAYRVLSECLNPEALSEERRAQFPTTALPNQRTPPSDLKSLPLISEKPSERDHNIWPLTTKLFESKVQDRRFLMVSFLDYKTRRVSRAFIQSGD